MPDSRSRRWLETAWYSPTAPLLLRPLAALFRAVVAMRRAGYQLGLLRSGHPGIPVVVVGNICVGGTGKTPLTRWIAGELGRLGVKAGIATRGFGGSARSLTMVTADSDVRVVGDEALLLARSGCPVCISTRRLAAAQALRAAGCDIVICDDGLQHLALRRDLEIAVVDAVRGFGNGALLPAGPLRESITRLNNVDMVVINGVDTPEGLPGQLHPLHMTLVGDEVRALQGCARGSLSDYLDGRVHAVAGIGNPGRFFESLRTRGLQIVEHAFPDHHVFVPADLDFGDTARILMTEKDAVKCLAFADARMWEVPIAAQFENLDAQRLMTALRSLVNARA
jgi:tetraacyldisaccharide 4'-kinase